jgi:putative oxidoreductase
MKYLVLLGRILFSAIFILSGFEHFSQSMIQYAASQGVPLASVLVPLSGIIAILGGLSILIGYKARYGAWLIVIFLIPITLMMHQFWNTANPNDAMTQQIMFLKNLAMLGGAFLITYFGSGPLSIDRDSTKFYPY